ncbi:MAG: hypothetical protein K6F01_12710 [Selenomonas sp.]|uniref:hypothetical protein n=1 Tax=Selenomonas sp. TaxID=2053611 RepID=UPI0025D77117|nr:hypothetical protein [Selenomonas sp.]MCR5440277.1 hypothetical protein [Selenomonas sp.]
MAKKMTEREQFYYGKGYVQGKIDFAKEVVEQVGCISTCYGDEYDNGVDYAVRKVLEIIEEMVGGSDGRK